MVETLLDYGGGGLQVSYWELYLKDKRRTCKSLSEPIAIDPN